MIKTILTDKAPAAVGPYSQALEVNGFVFCSGQIGIDPKTGNLVEGFENQVRQVLSNLKAVLEGAESNFEHVVKTTVFIKNMNDYPLFNKVYGEYFADHKPARATVEVSRLPKDCLIEIEAIAVKN